MLLEMIGELNYSLHPLYIYLTFCLLLICSYGLFHMNQYQLAANEKIINYHDYSFYQHLKQKVVIVWQWISIQSWLTNKMKSKDSPDDEDNQSFSFNQSIVFKRGGETCNLYSLSLKNIVILDLVF
ncbi:hypothetical protein SH601_15965 [Gracilibacillus sp. S3-1-1]|uniref:Uncharacterized protein n=1 Tax=Gracilibacillus pellucidus TaxID=3095368 RepID=A0ACC6M9A9_9BACI|nr:hypothetical protein [Gracilibacillus sp. S3-1-1]MDX8047463.1 hypothetical protein [Gracilibacillus sp. S3-1-1]